MLDELEVDEEVEMDIGPSLQAPALSWSEEKRLRARLAWRESLEWLMLPDVDQLDPETLLRGLIARPAWHQRAACRGTDPALFFPERGGSAKLALAYCEESPVTAQCRSAAFEAGEHAMAGVWGGTTALDRRKMRSGSRSVA